MESSPKRDGAPCYNAPISKLTGWAENSAGSGVTQACTHSNTVVELMPQGHPHHAREVCTTCRRFIRWSAKPTTLDRRTLNSFRIARLGMCEGLSKWERGFVRDISQRRKLSPKQQQIIDRLCADYLEAKPS